MKNIGIMGGTFNPIHVGHLIAAEVVRDKRNLDKIIFIPTGNPPHKRENTILDSKHRYAMVELAIMGNKKFEASDMEINRLGKTYTYDTLMELHKLNEYNIHFIIGYDTLKEIDTWMNIDKVCKLCSFIVVNRNNSNMEMLSEVEIKKARYGAEIEVINIPNIEISSTNIRDRISEGKSIKYLIPDNVEEYIYENGLYNFNNKHF